MLLTVSTTRSPATDLGFLLHKNPGRAQAFEVSTGTAHVFYPEATDERCTAALLLEVDPVALVRGKKGPASEGFSLGQYVNDRPYACSSLLAVAMAKVFSSAMKGRSNERPDLVDRPLPLTVRLPILPCRGGAEIAERMFAPLGWAVSAETIPLDETVPTWGDSRYLDVTLTGTLVLAEALRQLYVLLPVLDDAKHYWVFDDEVDKLVRAGEGWLAAHPERDLITRRYLAHRRPLTRAALARLAEADDTNDEDIDDALAAPRIGWEAAAASDEDSLATPEPRAVSLAEQRRGAVIAALRAVGATRVLDLGCGGGMLLRDLLADRSFTEIVGTDVSVRALAEAERRLRVDRMPEMQAQRLTLLQSALTYTDDRLVGYDAAVLMEVIEHLDPPRLSALEHNVFTHLRPKTVIVTTPNGEYNVRYETLPAGTFRHRDHRFEWNRREFEAWASGVGERRGFDVRFLPVGEADAEVGPSTQMAVFTRADGGAA